jgi:hypothetical protein
MTNLENRLRRFAWLVMASMTIAMNACGGGHGSQGTSSAGSSVTPSAPSLRSIAITATPTSIATGATLQFSATGTYSDASTQTLTRVVMWSSSSVNVATISNSGNSQGLATAANPGSTSIVASSGTITSPAVILTVTGSSVTPPAPSLRSIAITATPTTIATGATLQFSATGTYSDASTQTLTRAVMWSSSSANVATISNSSGSQGLATAANPGSTSIVASSGTITSPAVTLTVTGATRVAKSAKRGVAYDLADPRDFAALSPGVSWWYNWSSRPNVQAPNDYVAQYQMDFYPMLWNGNYDAAAVETFLVANPGIKFLLVVNEPNLVTQANLTPQQAANLWPGFEAIAARTGVKIVGPAITWGTMPGYADPVVWLDAFYAAYRAANGNRDPQVDYLAFHWYDYGLDAQLNRLTKYGKPFWVTEFANWHSQVDGAQIDTAAKQAAQMTDMVAICESRADVVRYAWFTGRMSGDIHFTSLLAAPGQLTALGQLYLSLPYATP